MVTNNFKKLIFSYFFNSGATGHNTPYGKRDITLTNSNGGTETLPSGSSSASINSFSANINTMNNISENKHNETTYIKVGGGTTPPTSDDYELESVNSDITVSSASTAPTDSLSKIYTATLNNPTDNDINITEIGLYSKLAKNAYDTCFECLLDRTVLSTPITIPAGQSKSITYEIGF